MEKFICWMNNISTSVRVLCITGTEWILHEIYAQNVRKKYLWEKCSVIVKILWTRIS
jgi:hypothetical protein